MTLIPFIQSVFFTRSNAIKQPLLLTIIGLSCVIIYAFTRTGFPEIARITSTIAGLLGFWGLYKYGKEVNSHILFRFVWCSIIIQSFSWLLSQYSNPEWALAKPDIEQLTRWLVFIPLAWWIAQYRNAIWLMYGFAALGIVISPWTSGYGLKELLDGTHGRRVDFSLENAQHTSLLFGIVLIGLCSFIKPIIKKNKLFSIPVILLISYCLVVIYISSSRQAWLALVITLLISSLYFVIKAIRKSSIKKQLFILSFFCIGLIALSHFLMTNEKIVKRVMTEKKAINAVMSLEFDRVPYTSFGIRLHSWIAAIDFIKEKPFLGWGSNGKTLVIKHTKWLPEKVKKHYGHLHNTYLEILVNFGAIGLIFYFSVWIYFIKKLYKEIKKDKIEREIGYFFAAFLCFWSIMNLFESYNHYWTGFFCLHIIMAGILSRIWHSTIQSSKKK